MENILPQGSKVNRPTPEQARLMAADVAMRQEIKVAQIVLSDYEGGLRIIEGGRVDWHQIEKMEAVASVLGRVVSNLKRAALAAAEASEAMRYEALGAVAVYPLAAVPPPREVLS